eukprot:52867-Pyramimonas_sp.AAC.1
MPKRKGKNFNSQPKFTGASGTQATPAAPSSCAKQPTTAGIYTPKPSQVEVLEAQIRVFVGRETDYRNAIAALTKEKNDLVRKLASLLSLSLLYTPLFSFFLLFIAAAPWLCVRACGRSR